MYTESFTATFSSAYSTLEVLDRQARRDTSRLIRASYSAYCFLSSPEMLYRYRRFAEMTRRILEILWLVALATGSSLQRMIEDYVAVCQELPVEPEVEVVITSNTEDQPAMVDVDPTPVNAPETAQTTWTGFSVEDLRKECQPLDIRWRNAGADSKHLEKSEMIAAIEAYCFAFECGAIAG